MIHIWLSKDMILSNKEKSQNEICVCFGTTTMEVWVVLFLCFVTVTLQLEGRLQQCPTWAKHIWVWPLKKLLSGLWPWCQWVQSTGPVSYSYCDQPAGQLPGSIAKQTTGRFSEDRKLVSSCSAAIDSHGLAKGFACHWQLTVTSFDGPC